MVRIRKHLGDAMHVADHSRKRPRIDPSSIDVEVEPDTSRDANYDCMPKGRIEALVTAELVGESFKSKLDEIWSSLMKDDVWRFGIYGMGGVGKTEMGKHIYNKLLESSNFGLVYWVTVSLDFSVYKLQNAIAEALGLDLSNIAELNIRAARLLRALSEKEKVVLIFDDVWSYIPFDVVGVPDNLNGCKVVITTRSLDICHMLNCHETFRVDCLRQRSLEDLELFIKQLGAGTNLSREVECIATSIVCRCGGLPLMIISMARKMRGKKDICQWRDALEEAKGAKTNGAFAEVFHNLKLSYDNLEDQYLQQCFLYCALFGQISGKTLMEHLIVEGIIEGLSGRQTKSDKARALLYKLENACLLQRDDNEWCFYMHELVRKMAFCIMNETLPSIINIGERINYMPDKHHSMQNIVRISFTNNRSSFFPPNYLGICPNVSTLLLPGNEKLTSIKDSFLDQVKGLKILNLSGSIIVTLPESVGCLENLRSLFLNDCTKLKYIPSLTRLKLLEVLDLGYCYQIKELPRGVELLYNLTFLNLIYTGIQWLETGTLTGLLHLEFLQFFGPSGAELSREVANLAKLESLVWCFSDIRDLYTFLESTQKRLFINCILFVGEYSGDGLWKAPSGKVVVLNGCNTRRDLLIDEFIQKLIISDVSIDKGSGFCFKRSMQFYSLKTQLKSLVISDTEEIEYLFCLSSYPPVLQSLETLELTELPQLHDLFGRERDGVVPSPATIPDAATFSNLKTFKISECSVMKTLFHFSLLPNLQNLEEITVDECSEMEEIIAAPEQESDNPSNHSKFCQALRLSFPKLKTLEMTMLPKLKSICSAEIMWESLEDITIYRCKKLKIIPISLPLPSLKTLEVCSKSWWESVHWGLPYQKDSLQPKFSDYCNETRSENKRD